MTSPTPQPFYVPAGTGRFLSQPSTASPWGPTSQHGSPPSALLARAIERLDGGDRFVGRITVDLLGPVPVGPLSVEASVVRPGRNLDLCEATLVDEEAGRAVARASAWRFPAGTGGPRPDGAPLLPHGPSDGVEQQEPEVWSPGYVQAVEWRWVKGGVAEMGPAVVWMRPRVALVEGEETTPFQALMACVDSASGVSSELDAAEWGFQNPELTVHLLREPVGDWFCLDAETTLAGASAAIATSSVYDVHGLVARTTQSLLTLPRR